MNRRDESGGSTLVGCGCALLIVFVVAIFAGAGLEFGQRLLS